MQAKPVVSLRAPAAHSLYGEEPEKAVLGLFFSYSFL